MSESSGVRSGVATGSNADCGGAVPLCERVHSARRQKGNEFEAVVSSASVHQGSRTPLRIAAGPVHGASEALRKVLAGNRTRGPVSPLAATRFKLKLRHSSLTR